MIANAMTPNHIRPERGHVTRLVDRCQVLAGQFNELSSSALLCEMNEIVARLSPSLSRPETIVVAAILDRLLARLVRSTGLDMSVDVTRQFLRLVDADLTMDGWRRQWFRVTESCAAHLCDVGGREGQIASTRITRMLRSIHMRYTDPNLTMRYVAETVNLCPSHAARLLKQQIGCGFVTYLHRCRILLACRLLTETRLSMKEIAAASGYTNPSQFSRHFKIICGKTPLAFRTAESLT